MGGGSTQESNSTENQDQEPDASMQMKLGGRRVAGGWQEEEGEMKLVQILKFSQLSCLNGGWGSGGRGGRRRREGNGDSVKISTATRDGGIMQMSGWEIFRWNQSNKNESTDGSISE